METRLSGLVLATVLCGMWGCSSKPIDTVAVTPPANEFDRNPYLSSILKPILPPHTTIMEAAAGFKNERQFIAALHLSSNMNVSFDKIKKRMTGEHRMSLLDSVRDIYPDMTKNLAKAEVNKAEQQARDDETRAQDEARKAVAREKVATNGKP
jgi:cation transport regulator ChaB